MTEAAVPVITVWRAGGSTKELLEISVLLFVILNSLKKKEIIIIIIVIIHYDSSLIIGMNCDTVKQVFNFNWLFPFFYGKLIYFAKVCIQFSSWNFNASIIVDTSLTITLVYLMINYVIWSMFKTIDTPLAWWQIIFIQYHTESALDDIRCKYL